MSPFVCLVLATLVLCVDSKALNVWSMSQTPINNQPISQTTINNRPIIGILAEPTYKKVYGDEFIESTYVQYLESAGARVVPVRGNQPPEYYRTLFKNINGVLFPGGGTNITAGAYHTSGKFMYDMALEANDKGDYFPIWGTCLGMELLTALTSGEYLLNDTDSENLTLPLNLLEGFWDSKLFKEMPMDIVRDLQEKPVTQNNHRYSLLKKTFEMNAPLNKFYKLLSTNVDRNNLEFVSTMEAISYPVFATQWHPEKNIYLWAPDMAIDHNYDAIEVAQYMANFFVNQARRSSHHYDSTEEEARAVIENFVRVYPLDNHFTTYYYFNYTTGF